MGLFSKKYSVVTLAQLAVDQWNKKISATSDQKKMLLNADIKGLELLSKLVNESEDSKYSGWLVKEINQAIHNDLSRVMFMGSVSSCLSRPDEKTTPKELRGLSTSESFHTVYTAGIHLLQTSPLISLEDGIKKSETQEQDDLTDSTRLILYGARQGTNELVDKSSHENVSALQQFLVFEAFCYVYFFELTNIMASRYGWEDAQPFIVKVMREMDVAIESINQNTSGKSSDSFSDRYNQESSHWKSEGQDGLVDPMTYLWLLAEDNFGKSISIGDVMALDMLFMQSANEMLDDGGA
jgi:hypothetical protein